MKHTSSKKDVYEGAEPLPRELPRGTPAWITPELIELTQKVWQPYYAEPLTVDDAITILRNAGGLLDALARR